MHCCSPRVKRPLQAWQRLRRGLLGVTAVVLAALVAAFQIGGLAAWVPVVITIATSIAAARYDPLVIEYLRTAQRLQHLCQDHLDHPASDPAAFIDACEAAIWVENQAWMARWNPPTHGTDLAGQDT